MLKFLGVVFIAILLGVGLTLIDGMAGSEFLKKFAQDQSLQIMATALALNVATITFLTGSLLEIEGHLRKTYFKTTRRELKDNVIAMGAIFCLNFFAVTGINIKVTLLEHLDVGLAFASVVLMLIFGALVLEASLLVLKIRNPRAES